MAVKLLAPYNGLATGTIMNNGDTNTEKALVAQNLATFNLAGGRPYVQNDPFVERPPGNVPLGSMTPITGGFSPPFFVGALGDSITQKNQLLFDNSLKTPTALYAVTDRTWQPGAWLLYGSMRSANRWAPWDFNPGFSGGNSAQILAITLPSFLGYPNGLPDACFVLAGTNDTGQGVSISVTLANLRQIYQTLLDNGVRPIAMSIPPNAGGTLITLQLNWGIRRLAQRMNIPYCDVYSALVNPANGQMQANYTLDGTHPTARGAAVMGYMANQTVIEAFGISRRRGASYNSGLGLNLMSVDPNLLAFTGVLDAASSSPNSAIWGAPADATMCKINSAAGVEPGTGFTMDAATPNIMGDASTPNYIGNSLTVSGNGTSNYNSNNLATCITYNVGDRIALAFRIKSIMAQGQTNPGVFNALLRDNTLGTLMGLFYDITAGDLVSNGQASIGNEAAYPAGDFYTEITVPAGAGGLGRWQFRLSTSVAGLTSNAGDSITIANLRMLNLTQLQIASP